MDIEYELRGIRFRWNESKAKLNIKNHDVSFEQAAQVFFDPLVQYQDASRNDEIRDAAVGCDFHFRALFVVHLEINDEFIRIISARKAEPQERDRYET
ncbi:MAG: BrnT family toxin [Gallionellaceae bacterium]